MKCASYSDLRARDPKVMPAPRATSMTRERLNSQPWLLFESEEAACRATAFTELADVARRGQKRTHEAAEWLFLCDPESDVARIGGLETIDGLAGTRRRLQQFIEERG